MEKHLRRRPKLRIITGKRDFRQDAARTDVKKPTTTGLPVAFRLPCFLIAMSGLPDTANHVFNESRFFSTTY